MEICVETFFLEIHTHTHTHTHTQSLSSKEYITEKVINKSLISFKNDKSPDNDELAK